MADTKLNPATGGSEDAEMWARMQRRVNITLTDKVQGKPKALIRFYTEDEVSEVTSTISSSGIKEDLNGKMGNIAVYYPDDANKPDRILYVGLGKNDSISMKSLRKAVHSAIERLQNLKLESATVSFPKKVGEPELQIIDILRELTKSLIVSTYKFDKYLTTEGSKAQLVESLEVEIPELTTAALSDLQKAVEDEKIIATSINFTRDMGNERAETANPEWYEQQARKLVSQYSPEVISIEVLQQSELKKLGLNMLCAVGQGAKVAPRLVLIDYKGAPNSQERVAIVGKGITFDTGGLNLKGTGFIESMYMDNCGAAAVLGTVKALVELKVPQNVVAVLCLAENAISDKSLIPSTILRSYKGITVEVKNTDAEGRLVLADGLTYVQKHYNPTHVVDLATLTGACIVALGEYAAGLFTNDDTLQDQFVKAGKVTGDTVWPLPILDEHSEEIKGKEADINNLGKGRNGGASTAAAFLKEFIEKDTKWAHIDIAGPAMSTTTGASGFGVHLLMQWFWTRQQ